MITLKNIKKRFGEKEVLNGLSFSITAGEIYGLLGPNGAGKTTAINILCNLLDADSGDVMLSHQRISESTKYAMGIVPQEISVYKDLTCIENLRFFAELFGIPAAARRKRMDELIRIFGLEEYSHTEVKKLSGGWQRRINIAVALVHSPSVLILDEPTAGLDVEVRHELWRLIKSLQYRTTLLLFIPAAVAGMLGGILLAQSILNRLFDGVVLFRDFYDLLLYVIVGLIVVAFVILFDYLNTTRKEKERQLEKEKERAAGLELLTRDATIRMLRSRLNPHFLFNTLNSISELIYQEPEKAEKAVMNLSEIYRRTLAMSEEDTVAVSHELDLMEAYLENECMRFGDRLAYRLVVDPGCESVKIPALILQPFVENAITRGIAPKKEGGSVSISVKPENGGLLFSIEDTGAGCETFQPGFGVQNVLRRMELLYRDRYRFDFNSHKGSGTRVTLYIPGKR